MSPYQMWSLPSTVYRMAFCTVLSGATIGSLVRSPSLSCRPMPYSSSWLVRMRSTCPPNRVMSLVPVTSICGPNGPEPMVMVPATYSGWSTNSLLAVTPSRNSVVSSHSADVSANGSSRLRRIRMSETTSVPACLSNVSLGRRHAATSSALRESSRRMFDVFLSSVYRLVSTATRPPGRTVSRLCWMNQSWMTVPSILIASLYGTLPIARSNASVGRPVRSILLLMMSSSGHR